MLSKGTNHKEILCFFSTESLRDHRDANHIDNQKYEDHVEEYQQVVLLAFPMECHALLQLSFFHVVDTCNKQLINNKATRSILFFFLMETLKIYSVMITLAL